jgi:hypothetical protein
MSFSFPKEIETESVSRYTKLVNGTTMLRVLGEPIFGYETWLTNADGTRSPKRFELTEKPAPSEIGEDGVKQFMAVKVYNYNTNSVQVWQCTQKTLLKALKAYTENKKYGDPTGYDINIKKEGESKMTKYTLTADPPAALDEAIVKADFENPCDPQMLFLNGDPFIKS